jgi:hypothetical protein
MHKIKYKYEQEGKKMNFFGRSMLGLLYIASLIEIIYGGMMMDWITFAGGFFCFFIAVLIDFRFSTLGELCRASNSPIEDGSERYRYECEHPDFPRWKEKR